MIQPPIKSLFQVPSKMKWQIIIVGIALLAIILFLLLRFFQSSLANIPLWLVIVLGGIPLVLQIAEKLLKGDLGADSLAAMAIITAVILGEYLVATLIILMLASGQTLEAYATRKASSALLALVKRMPTIAHRKAEQKIEDIILNDINIGDILVIYPHETCPTDGIVLDGHGSMDESYLTGEPYVISKAPGAMVLSGAINGEAMLTIRASKLPGDSRYAAIVKVLEEAEQKRPTLRRLGDQLGAIFAPVALITALATWYFTGEVIRFLAVLVIATPCPLIIAIPITIISAISLAARQAIIIKDPTVLERLGTCETAIFDKTGTLTYGKPVLTDIITSEDRETNFILQRVASLERYSKHPLAHALLAAAEAAHLPLLEALQVSELPGQGLNGNIDNHAIRVTHRKKLQETHPKIYAKLPPIVPGLECIVLYDNDYAATFRFHDMPREESQSFISHLAPSHRFKKIMLISGDRESEVAYLGKLLNITELHASQTPEQKFERVRTESKQAATLFMGDGINDAPALAAATVGIAFGHYSSVTSEAAGAVILENNLIKVDELIHLSLNTRKIALQSAVGGMALSVIGMGFAAAGFITPVVGAVLQELIDVLAIANSLRLVLNRKIIIDLPSSPG